MEIDNIVKVEFEISDPLNRQGQIGKVINIKEIDEEESEISVLFSDGITGVYFNNCLIPLKK